MVDTREEIVLRLLELVATIPTVRSVYRNNVDINEYEQVPAVIIFDGDEETDAAADRTQRPAYMPMLVQMTQEIVISHIDSPHDMDLNMLRRELLKRVLFDTVLNEQIVKTKGNGTIRYLGCQTDVGWMRSMFGALRARFLFKYSLKPDEL